MGTRSVTIFMDGDKPICRLYRQFDGYPTGHGFDLARVCNRTITNGISGADLVTRKGKRRPKRTTANGIEELAALAVMELKLGSPVGGIYLQATEGEIGDWVEYIYTVRLREGGSTKSAIPTIACSTQTGEWPFNMQQKAKVVFPATSAAALVKRLSSEKRAENKARRERWAAEQAPAAEGVVS